MVGNVHTDTIEGFRSLLKRDIGGVYHAIPAKYLQDYANEYTFRYNHGDDPGAMFDVVRAASRGYVAGSIGATRP